jgi:hypothetical protein
VTVAYTVVVAPSSVVVVVTVTVFGALVSTGTIVIPPLSALEVIVVVAYSLVFVDCDSVEVLLPPAITGSDGWEEVSDDSDDKVGMAVDKGAESETVEDRLAVE